MDEGTYIITQGLWCRHLFYHFSDIFFTIMSLFQGGIFKGKLPYLRLYKTKVNLFLLYTSFSFLLLIFGNTVRLYDRER